MSICMCICMCISICICTPKASGTPWWFQYWLDGINFRTVLGVPLDLLGDDI